MRFGVVFPQTEIGTDPITIRDYAQAAEELGYHHILAYDHVIGANPASRPGWRPPYTHQSMFHEPFVLFGYLAGLTKKIELVTSIIILPQRQTVLVAKQAAALDVLSGGRLRLGIGIGWNPVEYEALGENFKNRGRRSEEQVEVMRKLWTEELVSFEGKWHKITDAGLNPLPIQQPIPIWFGGTDDRALRRLARLGDGWFPQLRPDETCREAIEKVHSYAREAGRDPISIGIEGRLPISQGSAETWVNEIAQWKKLGATHLTVNTMKAGLTTPAAHIDAIRRFKEATG
jgi:probable F420-dependent oxidoreductase